MKYSYLHQNRWVTAHAQDIDDFIQAYEDLVEVFKEWKARGVVLNLESSIADDHAEFLTSDDELAEEYGFETPEDFDE